MFKKALVIGAIALAAFVPVASATNGGPSDPVGSENAVVALICGPHYQLYANGFASQYVAFTAAGDIASAQDALVRLWWTIYVHVALCK